MSTILKIIIGVVLLAILIGGALYFSGKWLKIYEFICGITNNNDCFFKLAKIKNNIDLCEKITDETKQGTCIFDLAKVNRNATSCDKIKKFVIKRDCYYYFAIEDKNINLCDKTGERERECYINFIEKYANEKLCENIKYTYKYDCYHQLAFKEKDLSFCDKTLVERKRCYEDILRKYPDEDLCRIIENEINRKDCYYYLATVHKIVSYCDKAPDPMACCREVVGIRINKNRERQLKDTIKREEKEIKGVKFVIGRGVVKESERFNIGTGNLYYSKRSVAAGTGYFYAGNSLGVNPPVFIGNIISSTPCDPQYNGYKGIKNFCEFPGLAEYTFSDNNNRPIAIGSKDGCCNQGILVFKQGNFYVAMDFLYINEEGDLYYDYWYDTTGGTNFHLLCEE